jgi:hypothetical protein
MTIGGKNPPSQQSVLPTCDEGDDSVGVVDGKYRRAHPGCGLRGGGPRHRARPSDLHLGHDARWARHLEGRRPPRLVELNLGITVGFLALASRRKPATFLLVNVDSVARGPCHGAARSTAPCIVASPFLCHARATRVLFSEISFFLSYLFVVAQTGLGPLYYHKKIKLFPHFSFFSPSFSVAGAFRRLFWQLYWRGFLGGSGFITNATAASYWG